MPTKGLRMDASEAEQQRAPKMKYEDTYSAKIIMESQRQLAIAERIIRRTYQRGALVIDGADEIQLVNKILIPEGN